MQIAEMEKMTGLSEMITRLNGDMKKLANEGTVTRQNLLFIQSEYEMTVTMLLENIGILAGRKL